MRRCGHSERDQLFSLERREGEDTRRTVQVGPADEAMIQPLLERLEGPASEQYRVKRPVRMEEMP